MFDPRMTTYDSEISIYVADNDHKSCGTIDGNYLAFKKNFRMVVLNVGNFL